MKESKKYIYGLDLSMANTGAAIFDGDSCIYTGSIPTNPKDTHGVRLKCIYDFMFNLKEKYPPEVICIERGFNRFNTSTAVIYRVHGIVNMLFYDVKQIYYPPKTVKESIVSGKASKNEIKEKILTLYPDIIFNNDDESDAFAVALTYFAKEKGANFGKQSDKEQIQSNRPRNRKTNKSRKPKTLEKI